MPDKHSYTCQKCKLPLSIDISLQDLSKSQTNMLLNHQQHQGGTAGGNKQITKEGQFIPKDRMLLLQKIQSQPGYKDSVQRNVVVGGAADSSFVILPQFNEVHSGGIDLEYDRDIDNRNDKGMLSNRISLLSQIFQIVSSKSKIDYPICKDCSEILLNALKVRYDTISKERDVYLQFLDKLKNKSVGSPLMNSQGSVEEIEKLKKEEESLLEELRQLENKKEELKGKIQNHELELEELQEQKQAQAIQSNLQSLQISNLFDQKDRLQTSYQNNLRHLERLRKTNIYNLTFQISHSGPFGTINALRLGSLPGIKVPWQEINAAMGDVVLLLNAVLTRLGVRLKGFKLRPMGNRSRIEKFEDPEMIPTSGTENKPKHVILECFSSGEYQIERIFTHSKFDDAMLAILSILSQIIGTLKELNQSVDVPYEINLNESAIGGLKLVLNSKVACEEWTGACKFLLTDLKWVLAYSSVNLQEGR